MGREQLNVSDLLIYLFWRQVIMALGFLILHGPPLLTVQSCNYVVRKYELRVI